MTISDGDWTYDEEHHWLLFTETEGASAVIAFDVQPQWAARILATLRASPDVSPWKESRQTERDDAERVWGVPAEARPVCLCPAVVRLNHEPHHAGCPFALGTRSTPGYAAYWRGVRDGRKQTERLHHGDDELLPALIYEQRVEQMASALHEDCVLESRARYAIDPRPDPWQRDFHGDDRHFGQAHDLVRRIWPKLDVPSEYADPHGLAVATDIPPLPPANPSLMGTVDGPRVKS